MLSTTAWACSGTLISLSANLAIYVRISVFSNSFNSLWNSYVIRSLQDNFYLANLNNSSVKTLGSSLKKLIVSRWEIRILEIRSWITIFDSSNDKTNKKQFFNDILFSLNWTIKREKLKKIRMRLRASWNRWSPRISSIPKGRLE